MFARVLDTPLVLEIHLPTKHLFTEARFKKTINFFKRMTIYSENLFRKASYTSIIGE